MYLPAAPLLLVLFQLPTRIEALPNFNIFSRNTTSRGGTALADEFPTEAEVTRGGIAAPVTHAVTSILTAIYGSTLLLHPGTFPAQVQVITMMRATGFDKIEAATIKARQNFRQALAASVLRSPSLLMAAKSLSEYQDRLNSVRAYKEEVRIAKLDGTVTPDEERSINRLKEREIRKLKRDMRRLKSAGSALGRVWEVLDLDEIRDILNGMMFQMAAVMASSHSESLVGTAISRYCQFLNIGAITLDVNRRIDFPISRLILYGEMCDDDLQEEERAIVRNVGRVCGYSLSAYVSLFHQEFGRRLNSALVASTLVVRGSMTLMGWRNGVFGGLDESLKKTDDGIVKNYKLKKRTSGISIILLTVLGMYCSKALGNSTPFKIPEKLLMPLQLVERMLNRIVIIADRIL